MANKVKNLERFVKQWDEYQEEACEAFDVTEFGEDDASFVLDSIRCGPGVMDKYKCMAANMEA